MSRCTDVVLCAYLSAVWGCTPSSQTLPSRKVFIESFRKGQFPHKSVQLFFILAIMKHRLKNMCGNRLLRNDVVNAFGEINPPLLFHL